VTQLTRLLNHVELVHRPGERELAKEVFELVGCTPLDSGGEFVSNMVVPMTENRPDNVLYVSEVTPEQWALEEALGAALNEDTPLRSASQAYLARLKREPQRAFHFGIRCEDRAAWEEILDGIRAIPETRPHLKERLVVSGVFFPGDPGAYSQRMAQAFLWTDVVASGLLTIGQHIELQWHLN